MKHIYILFLSLIFSINALAQHDLACYHADPEREREHSVDITHMKVEVKFDVNQPKGGKVLGKVTHSFKPLRPSVDTLFFDAPGITILKAEMGGKGVNFKVRPAGVTVYFDKPVNWNNSYELTFEYEATPRKGIYFIGWDRPEATGDLSLSKIRRQIWTQGQGIDNRNWIPMYDNMNDKFTTETMVTFDSYYKVLSNGKLMSEKSNKDGTKTWHYKMEKPHAGYLLMLAIGDYAIKSTKTSRGTPVNFWYYPEFKERVELTSLYTEKMIEFLEDETGFPYAWGAYSQVMVQDFLYGAMENTTATIFGDFFFVDERSFEDRNYIGVNCHELTHQWFGDLITARDSRDIWLQENFATFYAKWFYGILPEYGMDEVKWNQLGEFNSAHRAAEKDNLPVRHSQSGTARAYPKGSSVLQMLRYVVGDDEFKAAVKYYLERHAFRNVEAYDFMNAFKDRLGYNLDWFFDQWVLRGGEPHYKINYKAVDKATWVAVEQIHNTDLVIGTFKMPIKFAVYYTDGSVDRLKVMVDNHFQQVLIPNPQNKKISFVVFDENSEILKKLTFERTVNELTEQAIKAANMADRYEALLALKSFPFEQKKSTLENIMGNAKEFHAVRAEAWKQWLEANANTANLPAVNLKAEHKTVRQTLASHLNPLQENQRKMLVELLTDKSYGVIETALDNLMTKVELKYDDEIPKWLRSVQELEGMSMSIRVKWLEYSIRNTPQGRDQYKNLTQQLISLASADYEFRTRVNAMQALQRLNFLNEEAVANILDAIYRPNSRLAGPAHAVLNAFKAQHQFKEIIHLGVQKQPEHIRTFLLSKGI
jgi:aminopeptidase N